MTALLVLVACSSKGASSHKQDAGVEVGAPTDSNGVGGERRVREAAPRPPGVPRPPGGKVELVERLRMEEAAAAG
jgi:hypothetical protein